MSIIKSYIIIFIALLGSVTVKAQSTLVDKDFVKAVSYGFQLPEKLKFNCEWMYAVVKVDISKERKIISYNIVGHLPDTMKYNFDYLIGYQFKNKNHFKIRSLAFFFLIDNTEMCKPVEGQKIFYNPNEVVIILSGIYQRLKSENSKTFIDPSIIIRKYYAPQY